MSLYSLSVFTVITSLSFKELYSILIPNTLSKPASNIYFEKLLENTTLDWSKIYLSLNLATINTTFRSFQFNVLFLNKKLHAFGITNAVLDSFCHTLEETHIHIFFEWIHVKLLHTPQDTNLRLYDGVHDNYNFLNLILLIFKYDFYISKEKRKEKQEAKKLFYQQ